MSICEFIISLYPSTPEKVQAWGAVLTVFLAAYALINWRREKHYDIFLNALELYQLHHLLLNTSLTQLQRILLPQDIALNEVFEKINSLSISRQTKLAENHFYSTFSRLKLIHGSNKKYKELYKLYEIYINESSRIQFKGMEFNHKIIFALNNGNQVDLDFEKMRDEYYEICKKSIENIALATLDYNNKGVTKKDVKEAIADIKNVLKKMG